MTHEYQPDYIAMGDCIVCGRMQHQHGQTERDTDQQPGLRCPWPAGGLMLPRHDYEPSVYTMDPLCGYIHEVWVEGGLIIYGCILTERDHQVIHESPYE